MLQIQIVHTNLVLDIIHGLLELHLLRFHRMQGVGLLRHTHQTLIQMQLGSVVLKIGYGTTENQPKLFAMDLGRTQSTIVDERHGLHMFPIRWTTLHYKLRKTVHADPM